MTTEVPVVATITAATSTATSTSKEPETFTREYVTELRQESAGYRTRANEAKAALAALEAAKAAALAEAEQRVSAAESKANERVLRAELKAVALRAGMVDLDGLKLADLSTVALDEHGDVVGVDELMAGLKAAKPYLFGAVGVVRRMRGVVRLRRWRRRRMRRR